MAHECCGPVIEGSRPPLSPESLMRARYCAFLQGNLDFFEQTLASEKREAFDRTEGNQSSVTTLGPKEPSFGASRPSFPVSARSRGSIHRPTPDVLRF